MGRRGGARGPTSSGQVFQRMHAMTQTHGQTDGDCSEKQWRKHLLPPPARSGGTRTSGRVVETSVSSRERMSPALRFIRRGKQARTAATAAPTSGRVEERSPGKHCWSLLA